MSLDSFIPISEKFTFSDSLNVNVIPIVVAYMGHHMREILRRGPYSHYSLIFNKLRSDTLNWFNSSDLSVSKKLKLTISEPDHHGRCQFKFRSLFEQKTFTFNLSTYASTGELYHASNNTYFA